MDAAALRAAVPRPRAGRLPERRHGRAGAAPRRSRPRARSSSRAGARGARRRTSSARFERPQDELRAAYAGSLGAPPEEVALTTSTSDGLGRVLAGLDLGPGRRDPHLRRGAPGLIGPLLHARARRGVDDPHGAAARASPTRSAPSTTLVACSHVGWVVGAVAAGGLAERRRPGAPRRRAGRRRGAGRRPRARLRRLRGRRARSGCAAPTARASCGSTRRSASASARSAPATSPSRTRAGGSTPRSRRPPPRYDTPSLVARGARDSRRRHAACSRRRAGRPSTAARARWPSRWPSGSRPAAATVAPRGADDARRLGGRRPRGDARPPRRRRAWSCATCPGRALPARVGRRVERRGRPRPPARRARLTGGRGGRHLRSAGRHAGGESESPCARSASRRRDRRMPHRGDRRARRDGHRLPGDPALPRPARRPEADRARARAATPASASASSASRGSPRRSTTRT